MLVFKKDHRAESLINHRNTLLLEDLARAMQIKRVQPKTIMSESNTKFQTIDQLIQNRNLESQIFASDHQAGLALQQHQFTAFEMDFLSDGSGITSCSMIAGISLALLMRRRRCPESPAKNIMKKSHSLFSTPRLSMHQIAEFLLMRHSNLSNKNAVFIKK